MSVDYPQHLLDGDVIAQAMKDLIARLKMAFPEPVFRHDLIPPGANKGTWQRLLRTNGTVLVGWNGWTPNKDNGRQFTGTLVFPIVAVMKHGSTRNLFFGTGSLNGPGLTGMAAMGIGMLHGGFKSEAAGTCMIHQVAVPATADWVEEHMAVVALEARFENVSLDTSGLTASLNDFLRLGETWTMDGLATPQAVHTVGGEAS